MNDYSQLILTRAITSPQGTFGILSVNGFPICNTCELPWDDNKDDTSCVPPGAYQCFLHNGSRWQDVWELQNVSNRTAILIHTGNTIKDTDGCIIVGNGFSEINNLPALTDSVLTLNHLRAILPDSFTLTIKGVSP